MWKVHSCRREIWRDHSGTKWNGRARRRNVSGSGLKKRGKQASAIENRWNASGKRKNGHVTLARLIGWQLSSRAALQNMAAGPRL